MPRSHAIYHFSEVDKHDIGAVGGKGANLGEMVKAGFPVPDGFIVSSHAYFQFLKHNLLTTKINHLIKTINFDDPNSLMQVSAHIKKLIQHGEVTEELQKEIFASYLQLGGVLKDPLVAIRSSATAEDLPTASFAGQQETFLNVRGEANVLLKIKDAWASLFEPRAMFYRHEKKFDHFRVGIAIVVQKMVHSETSGVMFTIDPVTNTKSKIIIEAIYGLGELIVQGTVTPDHYEVNKATLEIEEKAIAEQTVRLEKVGAKNELIKIDSKHAKKQKISNDEITLLAKLGKKLEKHYYFPQDIEWAIEKNHIYIVQTRAITTIQEKKTEKETRITLPLLLTGAPASPGIASGRVKHVTTLKDLSKIIPGDILVAPQTNPDYVPAMKKAAGIVTEKGGRTSHAAIVSRELGIPAVVGAERALHILKPEMIVTINGKKGEVYQGGSLSPVAQEKRTQFPTKKLSTATKVYVNLGQPDLAEKTALLPVDGVGLLRAEFMMADIGVHPKKMIHDGKGRIYSEKLADQIIRFCRAFDPRPVVYRSSDFKTNEYRDLIGGKAYEPAEPNPLLGYRGAYRYIHDPQVFALELEAIKIVRNRMGLKNLWLMLPYVRTVHELVQVKKIIYTHGLPRSSTFKIWMMVEIPSNVILLDDFIKVGIDGVSIGSNDLAMLILGTDRDNSEVAPAFDEQNEAVLQALRHVVKTAQKHNITSSICGQAPSLYPTLVEHLVDWGVSSISVTPDAIENVRKTIYKYERKLIS